MTRWLFTIIKSCIIIGSLISAGVTLAGQAGKGPAWDGDFLVICYHDVADVPDDPSGTTISTHNLLQHFSWLHDKGYKAISIDDLMAAKRKERALPDKPVLITFDDGYASFYERVFPLLQAFKMPAVLALEGSWLDAPEDGMVKYGKDMVPRKRFLSWKQLREIVDSGLVEIASHGYGLHYGELANPQGNTEPALVTRRYDPDKNSYETDQEFLARIQKGLAANSELIERRLGVRPRVMVWPFGRFNQPALDIASKLGMSIAMTLEYGKNNVSDLSRINRYLIDSDQSLNDLVADLRKPSFKKPQRTVQVDLDYIYDPDPKQQERNLGQLISRIYKLQISTVYLQAFADPDGDGIADALYFPNRRLPMRADLFNRVAWQLKTRAHVQVYAWLPILSFGIGDDSWLVQAEGRPKVGPENGIYRRLSPFDPRAREAILDIYEDLARQAEFEGLMFHDDGALDDFEDANPFALKYYREKLGLPGSIAEIRKDPDKIAKWTRAKTGFLMKFTDAIANRVRIWRPRMKTARDIFATPVLNPEAESWFAQNFQLFLDHYDYVCLMAMPYMENASKPEKWLDNLIKAVKAKKNGLDKTVFILQSRDWRSKNRLIPDDEIASTMRRLQRQGALHFGYYPDDFHGNHPSVDILHPAFSLQTYLYRP